MMRYSMTGYGECTEVVDDVVVSVGVQSLNGRYLDVVFNAPRSLNRVLAGWRKVIGEKFVRGNVEVNVDLRVKDAPLPVNVSSDSIERCYVYLKGLSKDLQADGDLFGLTLKLLMKNQGDLVLNEVQEDCLERVFARACQECLHARDREGKYLVAQIMGCLQVLRDGLSRIVAHMPLRREQLRKNLEERIKVRESMVDMDRWEQEVLYFLEKMNIEEECVRCESHIQYAHELLGGDRPVGQRLLFIVQELLREVNTIGAKVQNAMMQQWVVSMKQSLEDIKEQARNLL